MSLPGETRRGWIEPDHKDISIAAQCRLAGLARSSYYYAPMGTESAENLRLMREIDEIYLKRPYYGSPRMRRRLWELGYPVNHKRVERLMRVMGLQAVLPGPHTSRPHPEHRVYPNLLRGREVQSSNEAWCADITYVPMQLGYQYLVAVMDWHSRYVLAWELSNSLGTSFCLEALEQALELTQPKVFHTDQGSQFTSEAFTGRLESSEIAISMTGRGRAMDNVFVERLWRTVKYEDIYLRDYRDGHEAHAGLTEFFRYYNLERFHQSLAYQTPEAVYFA